MKVKTNRESQKASDDRQRALRRVQSKVWATPQEHEEIKAPPEKLRNGSITTSV
jgi:methionine salvage enolase-phosphatase E1